MAELVPFLMAGYPSLAATEKFVETFAEQGVTTIELGIPFSDPMADGPLIQVAAEAAVANGVSLRDVFQLSEKLHRRFPSLKIILFSYLNPLFIHGFDNYVRDAKSAGVAATLAVDLPPEEARDYLRAHEAGQLQTVFLASPTTSMERLRLIAQSSSAFIYYISRAGVTGEKSQLSETLENELQRIRSFTEKPVAVGFGISRPEQARKVSSMADAVVIGSTYIRIIAENPEVTQAQEKIRQFTRGCLESMVPSSSRKLFKT